LKKGEKGSSSLTLIALKEQGGKKKREAPSLISAFHKGKRGGIEPRFFCGKSEEKRGDRQMLPGRTKGRRTHVRGGKREGGERREL